MNNNKLFFKLGIVLLSGIIVSPGLSIDFQPWSYECDQYQRCMKTNLASLVDENDRMGLYECKLRCEKYALFWPMPRDLSITDTGFHDRIISNIHPNDIEFSNVAYYNSVPVGEMIERNIEDQIEWLWLKVPNGTVIEPGQDNARLMINLYTTGTSQGPQIRKNTNESYTLSVSLDSDVVTANITSENYFGARHGIESLFQGIEYDDMRESFVILSDYTINDRPEFGHRGLSLDTSRNFVSKEVLLRIIDGLSASKMNVLHWHIVDSQSYPLEMKGDIIKQMTQYGAYDPQKIYTQDDVKEIVAYANYRGVRVIPELDQPAHVGHGWNYPGAEDYTVCVDYEPWYEKCVEPPCGQLNPGNSQVYERLQEIYREFFEMFDYDTFHMGADEINFHCWNTSQNVLDYMEEQGYGRNEQGFIDIWSEFQRRSSEKLKMESASDLDIIVWTSHITFPEYIDNLNKDNYIIQIWTEAKDTADPQIKTLAEKGYRMIFTNVDNSYLDCGYGAWVGQGNNWCSPYKGWQLQYSNDLYNWLEMRNISLTPAIKELVLGGEAAMWTEQADDYSIEGKIFPRTAALGERLWSNPSTKWYEAEQRMLHHRLRLVQRGVRADKLQPEWCMLNGGQCYYIEDNPFPTPETTTPSPTTTTTRSETTSSSAIVTISVLTLLSPLFLYYTWH